METQPFEYDVFISHASEDQESVARPLHDVLTAMGFRTWYSETQLTIGDSLYESIDAGLRMSRFGVVILSPNFFAKRWPRKELDGLVALEGAGSKRILPVWHNIDEAGVREHSATLAGRLAVHSSNGVTRVAEAVSQALERAPMDRPLEPSEQAAVVRSSAENILSRRGLISVDGSSNFPGNPDLGKLQAVDQNASVAVLSLIPTGVPVTLEGDAIWNWADPRPENWHPLHTTGKRSRGDAVVLERKRYDVQTRYLLITQEGYIEWGRTIGGPPQSDDIPHPRLIRLGPLLWSIRAILELGADFQSAFQFWPHYSLSIRVTNTAAGALSHLGKGWREPWESQFGEYYAPQCPDACFEMLIPLPSVLRPEARDEIVRQVDLRLNRTWGVDKLRGHDNPKTNPSVQGSLPSLSDKHREDFWEG